MKKEDIDCRLISKRIDYVRFTYYPRYASMNAFLAFNADMWRNQSGAELYSGPMAGCGHRTYENAVAVLEGHKISVRSNIVLIMNGVQDQYPKYWSMLNALNLLSDMKSMNELFNRVFFSSFR